MMFIKRLYSICVSLICSFGDCGVWAFYEIGKFLDLYAILGKLMWQNNAKKGEISKNLWVGALVGNIFYLLGNYQFIINKCSKIILRLKILPILDLILQGRYTFL